MPIEITQSDLLSYHKLRYLNGEKDTRDYVNNNGIEIFNKKREVDTSNLKKKEIAEDSDIFELNDIVVDEETLNQWGNASNGYEDENYKEYVENQRAHKNNFLKEIKAKGLVLGGQNDIESNDTNDQKQKLHSLNY